jgi:hypothetical protein
MYKVILESDAITLVRIFTAKRLHREEIRGKTLFRIRGIVPKYTLYPKPPKQHDKEKIRLPVWCGDHDEIMKWLNDIPWMGNPPPSLGYKRSGRGPH